jgi:hypothetical protein
MAHEGVPLVVIQRQLGHANLGITSIYLQGIDSSEIISTVHGRPSPTIRHRRTPSEAYEGCDRVGRRLPGRPDGRTPAWRRAGKAAVGALSPPLLSPRVSGTTSERSAATPVRGPSCRFCLAVVAEARISIGGVSLLL